MYNTILVKCKLWPIRRSQLTNNSLFQEKYTLLYASCTCTWTLHKARIGELIQVMWFICQAYPGLLVRSIKLHIVNQIKYIIYCKLKYSWLSVVIFTNLLGSLITLCLSYVDRILLIKPVIGAVKVLHISIFLIDNRIKWYVAIILWVMPRLRLNILSVVLLP